MPTVEGKAYWCAITRPNTTFDPVYQVDLAIDDATAKDFTSRGVTVKTDDRGNIIKLKRKVERNDGTKNKRQKIFLLCFRWGIIIRIYYNIFKKPFR